MPPAPSAAHVRAALIATLYKDHRPELADLVASAGLLAETNGLWVQAPPAFAGIRPSWLEEKLLAAALASGLPLDWIHIWPQGREDAGALATERAREIERN